MKKQLIMSFLLITALLVGGCANNEAPPVKNVELHVAAAASLQDAAKEIESLYIGQNPNTKITFNFASSGTLQKQIEEGAPADLFVSAGLQQMDALAEKDLIIPDSRKNLLGNELVLIAEKDSALKDFAGLTDSAIKRISIGTPETVPAGKYAQQTLTSLGLYEKIQTKLVPAKDVRQVLTYVETGNVDAGLVYKSDTYQVDNIRIVATAPESAHKPIVYPIAVIKASQQQAEAQAFADFLSGAEAAAIFSKYGFVPLHE